MPNSKNDRLDNFIASPHKALFVIAAPMIAGFGVHAMYSIVDSIFIGKLGTVALAAAGYISAIFFIVIAFTGGIATGVTATVAAAYGSRNENLLNKIASNGFSLSLITGLIVGILGLFFGKSIIPLLGAEGESVSLAWEYMFPLFAGMPLFFVSASIRSVINGEGDARTTMIILGIATLVNLVLDPLFIFYFDMGIGGAAYATVAAQLIAILGLVYAAFFKHKMSAKITFSNMIPDFKVLGRILKIGFPAAAGLLVMSIGMMMINKVLSEFGQPTVAGYVAGSKIDMFVSLPLMGIASAAMTLTGMFLGAKRYDLVKKIVIYSYSLAVVSAVILGTTVYLFSNMVVGLFVKDPVSLFVGRQYLGYELFAYPLMAFGMTSGRILQGLGYGMPSLVITVVRVLIVGVTGAYFSVYILKTDVTGVWLSFIAGGTASLFLSAWWIKRYIFSGENNLMKTVTK
ncbi:MAG: MATE family efflux transporter [Deltaproteobacteria bacterium]|nr:MATE family efflux transporter [Deltaproteobacteria bacterium]